MDQPPYPPEPPRPPDTPNKSRTRYIAIAVGAAVAAVAVGVVVFVSSSSDTTSPGEPRRSATSASKADNGYWTEPEEPEYEAVDVNSFLVELRTTARQCFGSAGCNVTVEPNVTYLGDSDDLDPDATYEITYEISGDESGPVLDTMELNNQTELTYSSSVISTTSASTEVKVKITDVLTR